MVSKFSSAITKVCLTIVVTASLSSCVTVFFPKNQKVIFNTGNKDATVYIDKEKAGKGTLVTEKVQKNGAHQIVIKAPGYKDTYAAMIQTHRAWGYWICILFDIPLFYGLALDPIIPKGLSYNSQYTIKSEDKLVNRATGDKYIDISNVGVDIKNPDKDALRYIIFHKKGDLMKEIADAEKKGDDKAAKEELKKMKKKKKKGDSSDDADDNTVTAADTKYSDNIYKTLRSTGFVDTVNQVFSDNNNTLVLEGSIKKVCEYVIFGKRYSHYYKSKLSIRWYIKNTYNEILDSVDTKEFSGDFVWTDKSKDNFYSKMYGDAVDISYLKLQRDGKLTKYAKQETNFKISDPVLSLPNINPAAVVDDKSDAATASVIVKTKEGHGSGFTISQNGYIITNYHVIAGKRVGKLSSSIKVVTSEGEELDATVVRYNKFRDLALLKVNKNFDKAFKVSSVKAFKNMLDVYTIGAPKSIELGQSVSSGVISNERKSNNNNFLQLGMSVNGGNSGGPVFDAQGNLHGVIDWKLRSGGEGISFAIPAYMIQDYLNINYSGGASSSGNNIPVKSSGNSVKKR